MIQIEEIKSMLNEQQYDFLRSNEYLGKNVTLLTLGGSHAYGTAVENSDIDIRGIALGLPEEIISGLDFEQVINEETDTTIYSMNKFVQLASGSNPNVIELLGCKPEQYLYLSKTGQELVNNRKMFLSRKCKHSFGGYATQQLRRLQNALARDNYPEKEKEQHILGSMQNTMNTIFEEYNSQVHLYIGDEDKIRIKFRSEFDQPVREINSLLSQLTNIVRDYEKLNHRNNKKDDFHLNKHAMHLIRLLYMGIDIFEKEEIITYREAEHDLLMKIRNGFFQNRDGGYHPVFFEMLNDLQERFDYAAENTSLPEKPDDNRIKEFMLEVNKNIVREYVGG